MISGRRFSVALDSFADFLSSHIPHQALSPTLFFLPETWESPGRSRGLHSGLQGGYLSAQENSLGGSPIADHHEASNANYGHSVVADLLLQVGSQRRPVCSCPGAARFIGSDDGSPTFPLGAATDTQNHGNRCEPTEAVRATTLSSVREVSDPCTREHSDQSAEIVTNSQVSGKKRYNPESPYENVSFDG
jgi:hypothetical protein